MWADEDTFTALDADIGFPDRDFQGDIALLPAGGGSGEASINRKSAHRKAVTPAGDDLTEHSAHVFGCLRRHRGMHGKLAGYPIGDFHFEQIGKSLVDGFEIALYDSLSSLAIGMANGVLDGFNGFCAGEHSANREETNLHDGVDAAA